MFLSHQIQLLSHSDNVQVVAAGDVDDEVTAALHAAVSTATEQTVATVPSMSTAASAVKCKTGHLSRMRRGKMNNTEIIY